VDANVNGTIDYYTADIKSAQDYFSRGWKCPEENLLLSVTIVMDLTAMRKKMRLKGTDTT